MLKFKKYVAIGIVSALLCSTLVGCIKRGGDEGNNGATSKTITWLMLGDKQADMQLVVDEINKITVPRIGAKVDLQFLENYQDKMTMMIASGQEFDLCFTADWNNKFLPNVSKGAFAPLDDLISKYAPKLKNELPQYLWNASTVNGKIYAVPNLQVLFTQTTVNTFKKYVDKYGFDVSKVNKIEDIEPFLEVIKNNEKGVYPYRAGSGTHMWISPVYEEIMPNSGAVIKKDGSSYKLVCRYKTDEYKQGIKVIRRWYEKGYIRPDVATVINDAQDLKAGKYGFSTGSYKPGADAEALINFKQEVVMKTLEEPYLSATSGMSTMTAISRTSKNQEKAIKLLELVNTDKALYNLLCFGVEGKHYNKINEQQIDTIADSGYMPNASWKFGNQFNAYYLKAQKPGTWEETKAINNSAMKSPLAGFTLNTEPIKVELIQCGTVLKEYDMLDKGTEDPNGLYEKFIAKLDEAGQQKIIEEAQKQVDEWVKNKK
jgi:putative aldouronate transport system substrate-binding protein